nr:outer membrane protein assembly factor BamD [Phreatobacter oligotrophus]
MTVQMDPSKSQPLDQALAGRPAPSLARRAMLLATVAALAAPLGACANAPNFGNLFGGTDSASLPDEPAEKLYNEGIALQNRRDWRRAALKFMEIDRTHPYTEWAKRALIMAAYSFYESQDYEETINQSRRFLQLHPGAPDAAYAQYLQGAALYDQIPDVQRDQTRTERALVVLDEVTRKWPQSEYAIAARRKIEVARDQLAGREMTVAKYYLERRQFTGAINRYRTVVSQFQTTRHVEEALARLVECYMALGIVNEAQTAAAVLGHNFPDSQWYRDSYALIQGQGLTPREDTGSWISRAFRRITG